MSAVTTTQRSPAVSRPVAHRQRASRRLGPPIYRKVAIGSFTRAREVPYSNAGIGFGGATGSSTRPDRTIRRPATSCTNTKVVTSGRGSAILRHVVGVRQHATLSRNNGRLHLHQLPDFAQLHGGASLRRCSARRRGRRDGGVSGLWREGLSALVLPVRGHFARAAGLHNYPAATAVSAGSACSAHGSSFFSCSSVGFSRLQRPLVRRQRA